MWLREALSDYPVDDRGRVLDRLIGLHAMGMAGKLAIAIPADGKGYCPVPTRDQRLHERIIIAPVEAEIIPQLA